MASKTIKNSWRKEVEVSDEGGLIALRINAERTAYLNLTPEQASGLCGWCDCLDCEFNKKK